MHYEKGKEYKKFQPLILKKYNGQNSVKYEKL